MRHRATKSGIIFWVAILGFIILASGCDWFGGKKTAGETALSTNELEKINEIVKAAESKKSENIILRAQINYFLDSKIHCSDISKNECEKLAKTVVQNQKVALALKRIAASGVKIVIVDRFFYEKNIYMNEGGEIRIHYDATLGEIKKFLRLEE